MGAHISHVRLCISFDMRFERQTTVDSNWDLFSGALSGHYNSSQPRDTQVAEVTSYLKSNLIYIGYVGPWWVATGRESGVVVDDVFWLLPVPMNCRGRVPRLGLFVLVLLLGLGMLFAALIMSFRKISGITFTVLNNSMLFVGVLLIVTAALMYWTSMLGAVSNLKVWLCVHECQ